MFPFCKKTSLRPEREDVLSELCSLSTLNKAGGRSGLMYNLQESALHFIQTVWIVKEKKLLEMFKSSLSDVKCYANGSRNKAIFQSKFSPTQWIRLASQCHLKSLRYFRVFLALFRDSKSKTKKGRGGQAPFYICLRKTLDSAWLRICGRIITGKCLICVFATQKDIRGGWNH